MSDTTILFKAIAHPARRQILPLLAVSDQSLKKLKSTFAISQPAVSQHLRELRGGTGVAGSKACNVTQNRL